MDIRRSTAGPTRFATRSRGSPGGGPSRAPARRTSTWFGLTSMASNPAALADALNHMLLHGRMSAAMRATIVNSVAALPASNALGRLRNAIYLVVTSPQYLVER